MTGSPLNQCNHFIQERFSRLGCHFHQNPVRKHFCSPSHRTFITACFTNHRSRLTCNRTLINRSQPFDDLSVRGNHITRYTFEDISFFELITADHFCRTIDKQFSRRFFPGFPQTVGLCFSTGFSNSFGKIRKQQSNKQNDKYSNIISYRSLSRITGHCNPNNHQQHNPCCDFYRKHDRIFNHGPWIQFHERLFQAFYH